MCRLCLKLDTLYICVPCIKNYLKTSQTRNFLRRLIIDAVQLLRQQLDDVKCCSLLIQHYTEEIKHFYIEMDLLVNSLKYLQYFINRLDYTTFTNSEFIIKAVKVNWPKAIKTVTEVRQLFIVLIKHCPRILNHIGSYLKEINQTTYYISMHLKINLLTTDKTQPIRTDLVKTGCLVKHVFEFPWRGKPLPLNYQEDSENLNWDPFFEELPDETECNYFIKF
ncbi:hypothetical protein LCDV1gp075 [Lymphocystis disease virus 1]|uniref:hypothetical protein n=1 Tax=Fish lymphocystis disease virus TaxID=36363 RepID=UPI0000161ECF|nr:hypothetical protein LCDV1gp075 [Lymphocystis disease virus 1]